MKKEDLDRFFQQLAERWPHPTTMLLVGGAGSLLLGGARPTLDVDFEVRFRAKAATWEDFDAAVQATSAQTGIGAQYAESVERWSQLSWLDYRRHTRFAKRIGPIEIRVLEPLYWSIGKIGRYWDQDIHDMIAVFQHRKPDPIQLARLWQRVLTRSPKSTQLELTRRQALHFFEAFGKRIWGASFPLERIRLMFVVERRQRQS